MKIYESNEKSFINNGLGNINPIRCIETKKKSLNGWYVDAEVPIEYKELIINDNIVYVDTKEKGGQPFRIKDPKITDRKISFTARHIVYDSEGYFLDDVRPAQLNAASFLNWVNSRTDIASPFFVNSNITSTATKYFIRKTLLDAFEEAENSFNGVYDVDGYNVLLKNKVGNDNGASVIYGKSIESVSINESWSNVCTKLMPVGPDELLLPEKYVIADIQYNTPYTRKIDFKIEKSDENGIEKSEEQLINELRDLAKNYLDENKYPKINYLVKSDVDQNLSIGDIVHVKHPLVTLKTEVQSYVYNVLTKRVTSLEFGNFSRDIKSYFTEIKEKADIAVSKSSDTEYMINHQTDLINRLNKTGLVYIDENEILILDKKPKEQAKSIWRFGFGGIGFSENGYSGPYGFALTKDGKINADYILVGTLKGINLMGNTITGGTITGTTVQTQTGKIGNLDITAEGFKFSGRTYITDINNTRWYGSLDFELNGKQNSEYKPILNWSFRGENTTAYDCSGYLSGAMLKIPNIEADMIAARTITQYSMKSLKKHIKRADRVLKDILTTEVYSYKYRKSQDKKTHFGFVISEESNVSEKIISENKRGIDLYGSIALLFKGVQEIFETIRLVAKRTGQLTKRVNDLEKRIKKMEEGKSDR